MTTALCAVSRRPQLPFVGPVQWGALRFGYRFGDVERPLPAQPIANRGHRAKKTQLQSGIWGGDAGSNDRRRTIVCVELRRQLAGWRSRMCWRNASIRVSLALIASRTVAFCSGEKVP